MSKRSKQFVKDICRAVGHEYKYGHESDICNRCGYNSLAELLKKSMKKFVGTKVTSTTATQVRDNVVLTLTNATLAGDINHYKNVTVSVSTSNPRAFEVKMEVIPAASPNSVVVSAHLNL